MKNAKEKSTEKHPIQMNDGGKQSKANVSIDSAGDC